MKRILSIMIGTITFIVIYMCTAYAQQNGFRKIWNDPEILERIETGIEQNRKGYFTIKLVSRTGDMLPEQAVQKKQIRMEDIEGKTNEFGQYKFKGFYGKYKVTITGKKGKITKEIIHHSKTSSDTIKIAIK